MKKFPFTPYRRFYEDSGCKIFNYLSDRKYTVREMNQSEDDSDSAQLENYRKLYNEAKVLIDNLASLWTDTTNTVTLRKCAEHDPLFKKGSPLKTLDIKEIF